MDKYMNGLIAFALTLFFGLINGSDGGELILLYFVILTSLNVESIKSEGSR